MRFVAVYLVVAFHAGLSGFEGGFIGVDVFFVLSGYLVTGILLRDLSARGRVDFRRFYARRFRRILPAAAVMLLITAVAYAAVATPLQTFDSIGGFRASFLYVANWHFVRQATDYFASSVEASPVLHFWSLAVEEQFYFVWPLLFGALFLVSRRVGRSQWWFLRASIALIALLSAAEALHFATAQPARAYYSTDTRAYQLLAGALLALTPQLFALGARFRALSRWAAAIALGVLVLVGASVFDMSPISRGIFAAILTSALIIALEAVPTGPISRGLSDPRVAYLGRISYATYLWHWPLIVLITHGHNVDPVVLFVITAVGATVISALSFHYIEHPIRSWRALDPYRVQVIGTGLMISMVAGLAVVPGYLLWQTGQNANASQLSVSMPSITSGNTKLLDWRDARDDIPALPDCYQRSLDRCILTRGTGRRVLLMGDSIARMWLPAFTEIAKRESLTLAVAIYPACPWPRDLTGLSISPLCTRHRADWYKRIVPKFDPDIVFLSTRSYDSPGNALSVVVSGRPVTARSPLGLRTIAASSAKSLHALEGPARKVVILEPTPLPENVNFDPLSCVSTGSSQCAFRVSSNPTPVNEFYRRLGTEHGVWSLDLNRLACPRFPECDPVIDNIIVRRDHFHLTGTYARALSGALSSLLHQQGILPVRANRS